MEIELYLVLSELTSLGRSAMSVKHVSSIEGNRFIDLVFNIGWYRCVYKRIVHWWKEISQIWSFNLEGNAFFTCIFLSMYLSHIPIQNDLYLSALGCISIGHRIQRILIENNNFFISHNMRKLRFVTTV